MAQDRDKVAQQRVVAIRIRQRLQALYGWITKLDVLNAGDDGSDIGWTNRVCGAAVQEV
jgi:hypothetical protein